MYSTSKTAVTTTVEVGGIAAERRVILVDLRGVGGSGGTTPDSIEAMAGVLLADRDQPGCRGRLPRPSGRTHRRPATHPYPTRRSGPRSPPSPSGSRAPHP